MFHFAFKLIDAIFVRFPFIGKDDRRSLDVTIRRYKIILLIFSKRSAKSFCSICDNGSLIKSALLKYNYISGIKKKIYRGIQLEH